MTEDLADVREPGAAPARPGDRLAVFTLWTVAAVVVAADQVSKAWAMAALADGHRMELLGSLLGLRLVRNPGAAFSFATGMTWVFTLVALVVVAVVVRVSRRLVSMPWAVTLGLILGGAVGNLIDRLVRAPGVGRGHVIDFIDYAGQFIGNVADIAIVVAAAAVVLLSLLGREITGTAGANSGADVVGQDDGVDGASSPKDAARDRAEASAASIGLEDRMDDRDAVGQDEGDER